MTYTRSLHLGGHGGTPRAAALFNRDGLHGKILLDHDDQLLFHRQRVWSTMVHGCNLAGSRSKTLCHASSGLAIRNEVREGGLSSNDALGSSTSVISGNSLDKDLGIESTLKSRPL